MDLMTGEDNRIDQIRELVARHRANVHKDAVPDELDVLLGIDVNDPAQRYANLLVKLGVILDSAQPAPRVFFRGDTVPAGTWVVTSSRNLHRVSETDWVADRLYVELRFPSQEEWQSAVDRARAERSTAEERDDV